MGRPCIGRYTGIAMSRTSLLISLKLTLTLLLWNTAVGAILWFDGLAAVAPGTTLCLLVLAQLPLAWLLPRFLPAPAPSTGLVGLPVAMDAAPMAAMVAEIGQIAMQTSILAMNAAIEAARGQDACRGVRLLTDEIRALASRTERHARELQNLLARQ